MTASDDGTARISGPGTARELRVFATGRTAGRRRRLRDDGRLLLAAGDDSTARILTSGGRVRRMLPHPAGLTGAIFGADGTTSFTAGRRPTVRVWGVEGGGLRTDGSRRLRRGRSPSARRAAARRPTASGSVQIWSLPAFEPRAGAELAVSSPPRPSARTGAWSRRPARTRWPGTWDAGTAGRCGVQRPRGRRLRRRVQPGTGSFSSPSSRDHDARIWEVASGEGDVPTCALRPRLPCVVRAPTGRWVVTAGPTKAGLWPRLAPPACSSSSAATRQGPAADERLVHPRRKRVLTSGQDGTVRMYACICAAVDELVALGETARRDLRPAHAGAAAALPGHRLTPAIQRRARRAGARPARARPRARARRRRRAAGRRSGRRAAAAR